MNEAPPPTPRRLWSTAQAYAMAVVWVAFAILVRLALDPILGNRYTYTTVFLAVLASAAMSGRGPGLFAAVLGTAATNFFLIPPRNAFTVDDGTGNVGQLLNLLISVGIAALGGSLRAARDRASA